MGRQTIDDLLIRAVLDCQFKDRLLADPDRVMSDFELSDEHREVLLKPDDRLLKLLGDVFHRQHPESSPDDNTETNQLRESAAAGHPGGSDNTYRLDDVRILLRLIPFVIETSVGEQRQLSVTYSVQVDWLTDGSEPDDIPVPEMDHPGTRLDPVSLVVRVSPTATAGQDSLGLTWSAGLESLTPVAASPETSSSSSEESSETRAAAKAVLDAVREQRRDRLEDLARIITGGDA